MRITRSRRAQIQRGFSLLEGLIALLVFSIGALGMMEMQARAVQLSMEAQDRAIAAFYVNRLIAEVSLQDVTAADPDPSAEFLLTRTACSSGVPSSHPAATWAAEVCGAFAGGSITIARPNGVGAGFLNIVIEWPGRYKMTAGDVTTRDEHRIEVTNRFQWQS